MFEKGERHRSVDSLAGATDEGKRVRAGARTRWRAVAVSFMMISAAAIVACGQRTDIGSGSPDLHDLQGSSSSVSSGSSGTSAGAGSSSSAATSNGSSSGAAEAGTATDSGGSPSSDSGDGGRAADADRG